MVLQETDKQRINEIKLYILATNFFNYKSNQVDFHKFLGDMTKYIDFQIGPVIDLAREIFEPKYRPSKKELATMLISERELMADISHKLHISPVTLTQLKKEPEILFPRGSKYFYKPLEDFIEGYEKLFKIDYNNIIINKK